MRLKTALLNESQKCEIEKLGTLCDNWECNAQGAADLVAKRDAQIEELNAEIKDLKAEIYDLRKELRK